MVEINVRYEGDLHTVATHGPSGAALETDAPVDNQGRGESFSPTDLVATALGTCMLTIMGIRAKAAGVDIAGSSAKVHKHMHTEGVRRIGRLEVELQVPGEHSDATRDLLEKAALGCPVYASMHPDIEISVKFVWG